MTREEKVVFIERVAEYSHVSCRKLKALYVVIGDDLFFMLMLLADDELRFPSLRELRRILSSSQRSGEQEVGNGQE